MNFPGLIKLKVRGKTLKICKKKVFQAVFRKYHCNFDVRSDLSIMFNFFVHLYCLVLVGQSR